MFGWEWFKSLHQSIYHWCCIRPRHGEEERIGQAEERVPFLSSSQSDPAANSLRARFQRANTCTAILPGGHASGAVEFWVPDIQSVQPRREAYFDKATYSGMDSGCSTPVSTPQQRRYTMPSTPNFNLRKKYKPRKNSQTDQELQPQLYNSSKPVARTASVDSTPASPNKHENLGEIVYNISNDSSSGKLLVHIDKIEKLPSVSSAVITYKLVIKNASDNRMLDTVESLTVAADNTININKNYILAEGIKLEATLIDVECEDCLLLHGYSLIDILQPDEMTLQKTAILTRRSLCPCGARVLVKGEYNRKVQNLYITISKIDLRNKLGEFLDKYVYVKATVYYKYKKIRSYKTQALIIQEGTSIYQLNKQFSFVLSSASLNEVILVISLLERSLLRQDIVLGREILGPYIEAYNRTPTVWGRFAMSEFAFDNWCLM